MLLCNVGIETAQWNLGISDTFSIIPWNDKSKAKWIVLVFPLILIHVRAHCDDFLEKCFIRYPRWINVKECFLHSLVSAPGCSLQITMQGRQSRGPLSLLWRIPVHLYLQKNLRTHKTTWQSSWVVENKNFSELYRELTWRMKQSAVSV